MDGYRVVPQRLFANWEMDRTSSSTIQRVFTLSVSRLTLYAIPSQLHAFVVTAKLEGYKRTLRSNEVILSGALDVSLDISFTIQYPHFLKHKRNVMQLHIQRKRKYKNRPIPGGFKTVAVVQSIGRLVLSSCTTQPLDVDLDGRAHGGAANVKEKELSDDSEETEEEEGVIEGEEASGHAAGLALTSARSNDSQREMRDSQRRRQRAKRKNIKQRLRNLLKKFRLPEEESEALSVGPSSATREPTATELQALFDELDDLSDSANEGSESEGEELDWSSETEIAAGASGRGRTTAAECTQALPHITSACGESTTPSHQALAKTVSGGSATGILSCRNSVSVGHTERDESEKEREKGQGGMSQQVAGNISHSQTGGSLASSKAAAKNASINDQMYSLLCTESSGTNNVLNSTNSVSPNGRQMECIWLCGVPDDILDGVAGMAQGSSSLSASSLVATTSLKDVRTAIQQIVAKIQSFCNSNSSPPPLTCIGVMGTDKHVGHVLRAYIDALQHKSASSWLGYLRFALVVPPTSLVGRLIAGLDSTLEQLSHDIWERWSELSTEEQKAAVDKLGNWPRHGGTVSVNLPIGEALLQMAEKGQTEQSESRLFVPFLAEVRVGKDGDDDVEARETSSNAGSPRQTESIDYFHRELAGVESKGGSSWQQQQSQATTALQSSSPPSSPVVKGQQMTPTAQPASPAGASCASDNHELHVEYWLGSERNENILQPVQMSQSPSTPQNKKDSAKGSMKTVFRTLVVSRSTATSQMLSLSFVKEKKKEKMLLKLGMKNKQRSDLEGSPVQISSISRLLCSASSKHHHLTVVVDGVPYTDVRFFQTSSQWQTHVKHFPIALLSTISSHFPLP